MAPLNPVRKGFGKALPTPTPRFGLGWAGPTKVWAGLRLDQLGGLAYLGLLRTSLARPTGAQNPTAQDPACGSFAKQKNPLARVKQ